MNYYNLIKTHKYSIENNNGTSEICIYDISGNSYQSGAMIEIFTNIKNEYLMFAEDFDNKINKKGKYWKELTENQVSEIINAYDTDDDYFIQNIFNKMDCKTYKNINFKNFINKLI